MSIYVPLFFHLDTIIIIIKQIIHFAFSEIQGQKTVSDLE